MGYDLSEKPPKNNVQKPDQDQKKPRRKNTPAINTPPLLAGKANLNKTSQQI